MILYIHAVRENQKKLPLIMEEIAAKELMKLPEEIQSCTIVYLPEIGYLLAIPVWKENLTTEDLKIPNITFKVGHLYISTRSSIFGTFR